MKVPIYQIHKVIRVYIKELTQSEPTEADKKSGEESSVDRVKINAKGERQIIINNVTEEILERIKNVDSCDGSDQEAVDRLEKKIDRKSDFNAMKKSDFVFNIINRKNEKIKNKIPVDDSRFLLGRVESLLEKALNGNYES